jgi:hypothetical protein
MQFLRSFAVETGPSNERLSVEGAENEIVRSACAQTSGIFVDAYVAEFLDRFREGAWIGFQRLKSESP